MTDDLYYRKLESTSTIDLVDMEYALTACMEKNYKRAIGEGDK